MRVVCQRARAVSYWGTHEIRVTTKLDSREKNCLGRLHSKCEKKSQKPEESHSPRLCDARPVSGAGCALCLCVRASPISPGDDCSIYLFMGHSERKKERKPNGRDGNTAIIINRAVISRRDGRRTNTEAQCAPRPAHRRASHRRGLFLLGFLGLDRGVRKKERKQTTQEV